MSNDYNKKGCNKRVLSVLSVLSAKKGFYDIGSCVQTNTQSLWNLEPTLCTRESNKLAIEIDQ